MRRKAEVICPSCHEAVDVRIDTDAGSRSYVEECSICDEPMRLRIRVADDDDEVRVRAEPVRDHDDEDVDDEATIRHADVTCPACWETIELTVDLSAGSQTYTEDCTVCCRPMAVRVWVAGDGAEFNVEVEAEGE